MSWIALSLRRLRDARLAALGLSALVLLTAFIFGLAPRLLDRIADEALRSSVAAESALARNVQFLEDRRIAPSPAGDPLAGVDAIGAALDGQIPQSVRAALVERSYVVDTPRWRVASEGREPGFVRLRLQQGADGRIRYVAGRPPTGSVRGVDPASGAASGPAPTEPAEPAEPAEPVPALEVAMSSATAKASGIAVGDTLVLRGDATDPAIRGRDVDPIAVDVVGLFEVDEPLADFWYADRSLERPSLRSLTLADILLDSVFLLDDAAYPALVAATDGGEVPLRYTWRTFLDPQLLESERAQGMAADLRRMESVFAASGTGAGATGTSLRTGLRQIVEGHLLRWSSAEGLLAVVGIGAAAVALAALALATMLLAQRRQLALALSRGRGASRSQVTAALVAEGVVLALPATVLAVVAAIAVVPGGPDGLTILAAGLVGVAAVVLLVLTVLPGTATLRHGGAAGPPPTRRSGPRRLVLEGAVIVLAIAGAFMLRQRGLAAGVAGGPGTGVRASAAAAAVEPAGVDPLVAAVPVLLGFAVGLLAIRLAPYAMRVLEGAAAARPGLVAALALRRSTRGGSAAVVLLVLMTTVAIGTFASATLVHLDRAAEAVAWQDVGAPYRVSGEGQPLPALADPATLPAVEASAGAYQAGGLLTSRGTNLEFLALDIDDYRDVVAGTPAETVFPPELLGPPTSPISAIVSSGLTRGDDALAVGDSFELVVNGNRRTFRVAEVRDRFPSIPIGEDFVVISRPQYRAAIAEAPTGTRELYLRAPADAVTELRDAVGVVAPNVPVRSRFEETEALRGSPVVRSLSTGVAVAAAVAALYAALAVGAALALSGAARALETAHLRVFGLSRRQEVGLVVGEHLPNVVLALLAGLLLGMGIFVVLRPGLGLNEVVGSALEIPLSVEPLHLALLAAGIAVVVGGAIGVAAVLQRTAGLAAAVRRGME